MKMQALVALNDFSYAGRNIKAGRTFLASSRDAKLLVLIKRAQIDPAVDPAEIRKEAPVEERAVIDVVTEAVTPRVRSRRRSVVGG